MKIPVPPRLIALIAIILVFIAGCALTGLGPKQIQLQTRKAFNDAVESYLFYKADLPADEKAKIEAEVDPLILKAYDALDRIEKAMDAGIDISKGDLEAYEKAKKALIRLIPKIFEMLEE